MKGGLVLLFYELKFIALSCLSYDGHIHIIQGKVKLKSSYISYPTK
jgi:hypothetical protein